MIDTNPITSQADGLPRGTVTFLFTDIEGSTQLLHRLGEQYAGVLADQQKLLRAAFEKFDGYEVDTQGDSFFVSFQRASDAVAASVEAQRALSDFPWPKGETVRVRMGLHTGQPQVTSTGYVGVDVHRAARIAHAGHGGQVLLSETVFALVRDDLPQEVSLRNLGEHQLKDLQRPEPIYQLAIKGTQTEFPPIKSLDAHQHNLPIQPTPLIGREDELATTQELLKQPEVRLLTLTGPGGIGKTRLGLQLAAEISHEFPDGFYFVPMAPVLEPELVPPTIAQTLGIRDDGIEPLIQVLIEHIGSKRLLLLLDNFEQVIPSATIISELLASCANLKIVVTSREILHLRGEHEFHVPSLPAPDPTQLTTRTILTENPSIELFTQRAAAVEPSFELTEDNASTIAEICTRLEGLPLAIELAAARVKLLPPRDMLKLLTEAGGGFPLRLLSGGARDAPERHHALQATIDWSYQLLTQSEQWLFRCLSVFAGGFTLDAAGAVCCDSEYRSTSPGVPHPALEVLDNIASLLDKSLLRHVDGLVEEQRFSMLESIRKFGTKKLNECGENDVARDRNSRYCYQLALEAKSMLTGPQQAAWMDRLDDEHHNLRAALSWLLALAEKGSDLYTNEAEMALKMVSGLYLFWDTRGYVNEGRRWINRALAFGQDVTKTRVDALNAGGYLAFRQTDMQEAQLLHEQALAISRQLNYKQGTAEALGRLGYIHDYNKSPHEQVETFLSESLQLWREAGDTRGIAQALGPLAEHAALHFDFESASSFYSESLDLFRQIGDKREIAGALWNLGDLALRRGDCERTLAYLNESLELYRELKDTHGVATQLRCLAEVARCQGDLNQAVTLFEDGLSVFQEIGDKGCTSRTMLGLARVAIDQGDYSRARQLARDGMEICVKIGHILGQANQHWLLGLCELEEDRPISAREHFRDSLRLNQKSDYREGIPPILDGLARVAFLMGNNSKAVQLFAASEAVRSSIGISLPPIDMAVDMTKLKPHPEEAREALSEIDYQIANAVGCALTLEQAIELALENDAKDA